jgi:hypothetical protein
MILIIFISLVITFYFIGYFEKKRKFRNRAYTDKKKEAFDNLLNSLRKINSSGNKN